MSVEKLREEFERVIPAPTYVYWNVEHQRYMSSGNPLGCIEYQGKWIGWQASRESLVIELPDDGIDDCRKEWPERGEKYGYDTFDTGYLYACKKHEEAIEAVGLKVTL